VADNWATKALRTKVEQAVDTLMAGEVRDGAMQLWRIGMSTSDFRFAAGLRC
jgi:hypothetical protein